MSQLRSVLSGKTGKVFPFLGWMSGYRVMDVRWDLVAGTTLAFYTIPTAMAYASLAGLPPQAGIYCVFFAGIFYFIFGTSRHLSVGPTSSLSILVASTVGSLSAGDPAEAILIASAAAFLMGIFFLIAWIIRLSSLVNFISDTILVGFKAGAALVIASTQLPRLFGIRTTGNRFFDRIWELIIHLDETSLVVLGFGLTALVILVLSGYFFKGKPVTLVVVVASILIMSFSSLASHGIKVVGELPRGIPMLSFPFPVRTGWIDDVFFLAVAGFFLSYVESISAARSLARLHDYEVDARQELLALGAANMASSLGGGYAVAGGLSQSTINDQSGARSPFSLLFTSAVLAISLYFLTGLFKDLPEVILAVIVLFSIIQLIDIREMKHLFRVSRVEFWVAMLTVAAVLLFGILPGIIFAAIFSISAILRKSASPHIAILGQIPGTTNLSDMLRHPDNEAFTGIMILRPEASVLYYNVNFLRDQIRKLIFGYTGELKLVVIDLSSASYVDVAGARFLLHLEEELKRNNVKFRIVDALGEVRDILRAEGLEKEIGHISRRTTIQDILSEYKASN